MPETAYNIDLQTLKSFLAVASSGSFTRASEAMGRTQSAVSLQIRRLEEITGKTLFDRSHRKATLTPEGEIMAGYARRMMQISTELKSQFEEPDVTGEVRLGTPEDFATLYLPQVLGRFARSHPNAQLSVRCDLTLNLQEGFHKNELDIVLLKREAGSTRQGMRVWREPLVWASADATNTARSQIPLVLSPSPCVYRKRALESLDHAHRPWRMVYTSPSLAGTLAAVKAGLGISVLPKAMLTEGLRVLGADHSLPDLPDTEIALYTRKGASKACLKLAEHIVHSLEHALG